MPLDIKFQLNKLALGKELTIYKLLHDLLFILILFFIFAILGEGLLPGIVSAHISLYKILVAISINILAIQTVRMRFKLSAEKSLNKKTASLLLFVIILLFINSLLNLNTFLKLIIIPATACIFYLLYKIVFLDSGAD